MIRARAAFGVSRYARSGFTGEGGHPQIYSEDEISEDIELGARMHAAGYRSVYIPRKLASGEARSELMTCCRSFLCCLADLYSDWGGASPAVQSCEASQAFCRRAACCKLRLARFIAAKSGKRCST